MLAAETPHTHAFAAFELQLKTLCLREFPCGTGSWVGAIQPVFVRILEQYCNVMNVVGDIVMRLLTLRSAPLHQRGVA